MSWVRPILNLWLKATERRFLARIDGPEPARRRFEFMARHVFRGPRHSRYRAGHCDGLSYLDVAGPGAMRDGLILYFHGGGYFFGSPATHKKMLARLSQLAGVPAMLPDYRKAPEAPFPAGLQDALAAYALACTRVPPSGIVLAGDSAGGGLALALLHEIGDRGLPQPAMTVLFSPWANPGDPFPENRPTRRSEVVLPPERLHEVALQYADGTTMTDPRISPIYGRFSGANDVLIFVSDSEILFDDSRRIAGRMKDQNVPVSMLIERDLPHVWPIFHWILPEADRTLKQAAAAISAVLTPTEP